MAKKMLCIFCNKLPRVKDRYYCIEFQKRKKAYLKKLLRRISNG